MKDKENTSQAFTPFRATQPRRERLQRDLFLCDLIFFLCLFGLTFLI